MVLRTYKTGLSLVHFPRKERKAIRHKLADIIEELSDENLKHARKFSKKIMDYLIDNNIDQMSDWLGRMAEDDPKAAFQCMLSLMEFHMPKMSRLTWVDNIEKKQKLDFDVDDLYTRTIKELDDAIARTKKAGVDLSRLDEFIND